MNKALFTFIKIAFVIMLILLILWNRSFMQDLL